jgi:hypothetical protein
MFLIKLTLIVSSKISGELSSGLLSKSNFKRLKAEYLSLSSFFNDLGKII